MYVNTYIWNLERWYQRIYLQGSSRVTDIENRLTDMGRGAFSHITRSQRQRPSLLQTFRSQSEVFSPLPAGGLWLAFPSEAYSVLNRKAQTSTMPSTEKMLSMLPVTIVATTEKQSSFYEDIFLRPRLQQSMGISS